jgi:hypothetical protein
MTLDRHYVFFVMSKSQWGDAIVFTSDRTFETSHGFQGLPIGINYEKSQRGWVTWKSSMEIAKFEVHATPLGDLNPSGALQLITWSVLGGMCHFSRKLKRTAPNGPRSLSSARHAQR